MPSLPESTPTRVLCIEDDRSLAALVKLRLEQCDYQVDLAHDGEEGLSKCSAGDYDILIVDHSIPIYNGLEVIRALVSEGRLPPTIMVTGHGDEMIAVETMKLGADDYIVKDTSGGWLTLLPTIIERVLQKRQLNQEIAHAEEELRQNQKRLEEASRMAAVVAHEINNPLAGISGCFTLLKDAIPAAHRDYHFVEIIEAEITRVGRIVKQLYDLNRPLQEPEQDADVVAIIAEVVTMLKSKCVEHDVSVEMHNLPAHLPARVPENGLKRVLYNLVGNAVEASPTNGRVEINAHATDGQMQIEVSDEGPGIPEDVRKRIFDPFFTTKHGEGGLGLGLAICRRIVESIGGSLGFHTGSETGTTFRITMPLQCGEPPVESTERTSAADCKP